MYESGEPGKINGTMYCTGNKKKKTGENKENMKDSGLANTVTSHQDGTAFEFLVGTIVGV